MGIDLQLEQHEKWAVLDTYQKIESILKKCRLSDSLLKISEVCQKMMGIEGFWEKIAEHNLHPWLFAYCGKSLIKFTSDAPRSNVFTQDTYDQIRKLYYNAIDPIINRIPDFAPLMRIRLAYDQAYWQYPLYNWLPRYMLILLPETGDDSLTATKKQQIAEQFKEMTGISLESYWRIGYFLSATMRLDGLCDPFRVLRGEIEPFRESVNKQTMKCFMDYVSTSVQSMRQDIIRQDERHKVLQIYNLNPFFGKPIVHTRHCCLAPVPRLLLDKITHGVCFDLQTYTSTDCSDPQSFTNNFGHLFNRYIGRLLKTNQVSGETLINADVWDLGNYSGKRCDWVIIRDNIVVLIEVKSTKMPRYVIDSMDIEKVRSFFDIRFLDRKGLGQVIALTSYLKSKNKQTMVYSLIVVNDIFPNLNNLKAYYPTNDPRFRDIDDNKVQFITIDELECLVANEGFSLTEIAVRKVADPEAKVASFSSYLRTIPNYQFRTRTELFENALDKLFEGMGSCN